MRVDISFLPALAATFMLVFARIGAMVMLLPGFGESNIPVRIKLAIALLLTLIILPLHRNDYQVDLTSMSAMGVSATVPSACMFASHESFQPWLISPFGERRRYSMKTSLSRSP